MYHSVISEQTPGSESYSDDVRRIKEFQKEEISKGSPESINIIIHINWTSYCFLRKFKKNSGGYYLPKD